MKAIPYISVPSTSFIAWLTRQTVQHDIKGSPMQTIKKYRQKLIPSNLFSKSLILGIHIICHVNCLIW